MRGHRTIISTQEVCFRVRASGNASGSKLGDVENDAKFRTFCPPVIIRGVVSEISLPIVEGLPTTEPPKYI